jgi:hypothetical protein
MAEEPVTSQPRATTVTVEVPNIDVNHLMKGNWQVGCLDCFNDPAMCKYLSWCQRQWTIDCRYLTLQFNPNPVKKNSLLILDAPEHVYLGNMKFKNRSLELRLPTFFKTWFYFNKCGWNWQKMTKNWIFRFFWKSLILYCICSKNVSNVFHGLKNVKKARKSLKICQF